MKILVILLASFLQLQAQTGAKVVASARKQIGVTLHYDPSYTALTFPNGDVAADRGVCTDVVIRAMRVGLARDLQELVNQDMRGNFSAYPQQWGLSKPDRNIDHRRVPNLRAFFARQGYQLPLPADKDLQNFLPGDVVTCTVPPNLPHIMIVSDKKSADGTPWVIHNIGAGTQEEDVILKFKLTGHFRLK